MCLEGLAAAPPANLQHAFQTLKNHVDLGKERISRITCERFLKRSMTSGFEIKSSDRCGIESLHH